MDDLFFARVAFPIISRLVILLFKVPRIWPVLCQASLTCSMSGTTFAGLTLEAQDPMPEVLRLQK